MGAFNQHINGVIPEKSFDSKYLYYQIISHDFQTQIKENASSTTLPILNKSRFSILEVKVCNLKEQQEIVKEIETRFSVADKLAESIDESLIKAEALRQSILKKAFEGELELVACRKEVDWEPADKLLERIKKERKCGND
ncbi:MAG TPA: restriction endonuclease subunit S [Clostridiales bacterium]|nr:restriction endonuclease subunit S [Clostridiales bacterium]HQP68965.1 restriction endonuclease subunit S [Clostridiales bacterium]